MTKLETISNNHMSLECHCGHHKFMSVKKLISRLSSTATIYEVARKAVVLLKVAPNNSFYFTALKKAGPVKGQPVRQGENMKNNVFIPIKTTDCGECLITAPRWSWGYGGAV